MARGSVTFLGSPSSPEVLVTGSGFGSRPATVAACSARNTDVANSDLWIEVLHGHLGG